MGPFGAQGGRLYATKIIPNGIHTRGRNCTSNSKIEGTRVTLTNSWGRCFQLCGNGSKKTNFLSPHSITKRALMHFWSTIPVQNPAGQVAKMDDGHEDNICLDISTPTSCRRAEGSLHAWQGNTVRRALCTYVGKGLKWVPNRSVERNVSQCVRKWAGQPRGARFGPC